MLWMLTATAITWRSLRNCCRILTPRGKACNRGHRHQVGAERSTVQAELAALLAQGPAPIEPLRPQERQRLMDAEWAKLRRERDELGQYRPDTRKLERAPAPKEAGPVPRFLYPLENQRTGLHRANDEKRTSARNAAHERAACLQTQGVEYMRAQRYEEAAKCFERAAADYEVLATNIAETRDFLDHGNFPSYSATWTEHVRWLS